MGETPGAVRRRWSVVVLLLTGLAAVATAEGIERAAGAAPPAGRADGAAATRLVRAGHALTEAEALRLGLGDRAFQQTQDARLDLAASEVAEVSLRGNPDLGIEYEGREFAGDPSEATLRLSQTFDTSGRRGLRRRGAEARLDAARLQHEGEREERAARIRTRFYTALHEQGRVEVLRAWDARVGEAASIVRDREREGEASGYDLRRLDHERALARAERDEALARLALAWESLLALIEPGERRFATAEGRLLPDAPPPIESVAARLEVRPDLLALRQREESARLARQVSDRAAIPDLTVGLGVKRFRDPEREDWGLVLDLSLPLAVFDRGQAAAARADAESRAIAGEYELALREARGSLRGLWQKAVELQRAASRLRAEDVPRATGLAQTARHAYQAGEIGILELLDAHRSVKEVEGRALDLALESRLATIELERLGGGVGP